MSYRVIRPATHEEWLEERKRGIGSSDAGTIMGASPFQTPYGLYLLKMGRAEPVKESDAITRERVADTIKQATITKTFKGYSGFLTAEQSARMGDLLETTSAVLEDLESGRRYEVAVRTASWEKKTYITEGRKLVYYEMELEVLKQFVRQ